LEEVAVGDAGRREEDVVARDEVVGVEHGADVVAGGDGGGALVVVARPEPPLDLAPTHLRAAAASTPSGVRDPEEHVSTRDVARTVASAPATSRR